MTKTSTTTWAIKFLLDNNIELETFGILLIEDGAEGTTSEDDHEITAYYIGTLESAKSWSNNFSSDSVEVDSIDEVKNSNWTQSASELMEPLDCGILRIEPVITGDNISKTDISDKIIYIIPGMGFGTGHHATTRTILTLLSEFSSTYYTSRPNLINILDFGTGSGILAIAASKLFKSSCLIDAIDNDPAAIDNAKENSEINRVNNAINFAVSNSLPEKKYDIVLANVYAEVLCMYQQSLLQRVSTSGFLFISGIMSSKRELIDKAFSEEFWEKIKFIEDSGWITRILRRK